MRSLDDRILEHLEDAQESLTPWMLAAEIKGASRRRVAERCRVLARAGFTSMTQRGALDDQFELTGWGQLYLDGDVDAGLRQPLPAPRPPEAVRTRKYAEIR